MHTYYYWNVITVYKLLKRLCLLYPSRDFKHGSTEHFTTLQLFDTSTSLYTFLLLSKRILRFCKFDRWLVSKPFHLKTIIEFRTQIFMTRAPTCLWIPVVSFAALLFPTNTSALLVIPNFSRTVTNMTRFWTLATARVFVPHLWSRTCLLCQ